MWEDVREPPQEEEKEAETSYETSSEADFTVEEEWE